MPTVIKNVVIFTDFLNAYINGTYEAATSSYAVGKGALGYKKVVYSNVSKNVKFTVR